MPMNDEQRSGDAVERARLQLAVDTLSDAEEAALAEAVRGLVDIVEAGTPLILRDGVEAVRRLRRRFTDVPVLADLKICDGGHFEAALGFGAGASLVTVMGAAEDATLRAALRAAAEHGGEVMVDLLGVPDPMRRAVEVERLGAHHVCVHTPVDVQVAEARTASDGLGLLRAVRAALRRTGLAVAGGITPSTLPGIAAVGPEIVVVGGGITRAPDPRAAAAALRGVLAGVARNGERS